MAEARKVIIVFLLLLFVIIGLGVLFSRLAKNSKDKPILGEVLDNIFFSRPLRVTPTPTPVRDNLITIKTNSGDSSPGSGSSGSTSVSDINTINANYSNGPSPRTIPATGSPTIFLLFSGVGLGGGIVLKKFTR